MGKVVWDELWLTVKLPCVISQSEFLRTIAAVMYLPIRGDCNRGE
jgi:hypothetical protein